MINNTSEYASYTAYGYTHNTVFYSVQYVYIFNESQKKKLIYEILHFIRRIYNNTSLVNVNLVSQTYIL